MAHTPVSRILTQEANAGISQAQGKNTLTDSYDRVAMATDSTCPVPPFRLSPHMNPKSHRLLPRQHIALARP